MPLTTLSRWYADGIIHLYLSTTRILLGFLGLHFAAQRQPRAALISWCLSTILMMITLRLWQRKGPHHHQQQQQQQRVLATPPFWHDEPPKLSSSTTTTTTTTTLSLPSYVSIASLLHAIAAVMVNTTTWVAAAAAAAAGDTRDGNDGGTIATILALVGIVCIISVEWFTVTLSQLLAFDSMTLHHQQHQRQVREQQPLPQVSSSSSATNNDQQPIQHDDDDEYDRRDHRHHHHPRRHAGVFSLWLSYCYSPTVVGNMLFGICVYGWWVSPLLSYYYYNYHDSMSIPTTTSSWFMPRLLMAARLLALAVELAQCHDYLQQVVLADVQAVNERNGIATIINTRNHPEKTS